VLAIRTFGGFNLALGAVSLLLVLGNRYAAAHGGHNLQGLTGSAAVLVVVGACLLACRRWSITVACCVAIAVAVRGAMVGHVAIDCLYGALVAAIYAYFLLLQRKRINTSVSD
jgi:hypothetical protein